MRRGPAYPGNPRYYIEGELPLIGKDIRSNIMAIAAFHEILADEFFGASISFLVVMLDIQLISIGFRGEAGQERRGQDLGPLHDLWHSDIRIYPFGPCSKLEIMTRQAYSRLNLIGT